MNLIDADALIECIKDELYDNSSFWYKLIADALIKCIQDQQTIDAKPVRHGRWVEKPPYNDEEVKGLEFQIVCSECDNQNCYMDFNEFYEPIAKTFWKSRFCPYCGAKMDGCTERDRQDRDE